MDEILDFPERETIPPLAFAGFGIRFVAWIADFILIHVTLYTVTSFFIKYITIGPIVISGVFLNFLIGIVYSAIMESSSKQATIGKMIVEIKVGDEYGNRISFANALGRYLASLLSGFLLGFGYIMIALDLKHQGLHDKIAGTYVFDRGKSELRSSRAT
jgi:uncharacterized RDD family membrane protein YckC